MEGGSVTSEQRIAAAVSLNTADRTPVAPLIDFFAARYVGVTTAEVLIDDEKADAAQLKVFADLGQPDMAFQIPTWLGLTYRWPMRVKYPGVDLPADNIFQVVEEPNLRADEYAEIVSRGYRNVLNDRVMPRVVPNWSAEGAASDRSLILEENLRFVRRWTERGVAPFIGGSVSLPSTVLSYARSLREFLIDLHRRPDAVLAAMDVIVAEELEIGKKASALSGVRRVWVSGNRSCCEYLSPRLWDKFVWPYLRQIVNGLAEAGIVSVLHFDGDWNLNLPYFRELPARCCILELDGTTDIFKAKQLLGDRMCLMGDVPSTMLSLGSRQEVERYCENLINVVGEGGGFILSAGCTVPIDARAENVKAIFDAANAEQTRG